MPQSIPPAVIRRVNRVRARMEPHVEEAEVVLDDIFVLCRAFEHTWSDVGVETAQAQEAVTGTIAKFGITALPAVGAFVRALRAFLTASNLEVVEWFGADPATASDVKREVVGTIRGLQQALATGPWTELDSKRLGRLIYRMRCAVVHPSLDTQNSLAQPVLPALRAALVELTIARSAARYGLPLDAARQAFDTAL